VRFQASVTVELKLSRFWGRYRTWVCVWLLAVRDRLRSHLRRPRWEPMGCLETSVSNYQPTQRNMPQEQRPACSVINGSHIASSAFLCYSVTAILLAEYTLSITQYVVKWALLVISGPNCCYSTRVEPVISISFHFQAYKWCIPSRNTHILPKRSLLSQYRTDSWYTRKCYELCTFPRIQTVAYL
jgi:hypothetical protein